jgi:hypothetical protein
MAAATTTTTNTPPASTGIERYQPIALGIGVLGLIGCIFGYISNSQEFFRSYLPAWIFWFQIVAGSLAVLMLQYVTGGEWGLLVRRPLGAAARTMIVMALLFIPLALGVTQIYSWATPEAAHDPLIHVKSGWLNPTGWWIRAAIFFAIWILWAWRIRSLSVSFYQDRSPYKELSRRKWAASGILMIVFTLTLASVDWMMSLEPKWYSSMYGISFTVGCGLSAFAFVTLFLTLIARTKPMEHVIKQSHFRDLGNLMLAFTMLWAYTAFSQFLLVWYGNLKEEIPYYLIRQHGTWGLLAAILIIFHFFLPFVMLLMRAIKDRPSTIRIVTIIILIMRFVDIYWLSAPAHYGTHFYFSWMTIAAFAAIGGIWLWAFLQQLKGQTAIPIHETWVDEALRKGALTRNA